MGNVSRGWIVVGLVLGGLAYLGARFGRDPHWRDGIAWAFESWLRPADGDARWEQRRGR